MEQAKANRISFHELDQNGNPLDQETATSVTDVSGRAGRETTRLSINPFIVIIWVLAVVLITGGVWVHMDVTSPPDVPIGPDGVYGPVTEMPLTYVLMNFTPYAVLSGVLAIIGLLFWHAAQWQHKRR